MNTVAANNERVHNDLKQALDYALLLIIAITC